MSLPCGGRARSWATALRTLPADNPKLASFGRQLAHGAAIEAKGWQDYADGLRANNIPRVEHGDAVRNEGSRLVRKAVAAGDAYYTELGGAKAFASRSDFQHLETLLEEVRSANR